MAVASPMIYVMADEVRLGGSDAADIGRYLNFLANLIDPAFGPPYAAVSLTEQQRRLLVGGSVFPSTLASKPEQLAKLLRRYVSEIYSQLGDDAPEI
jgi:hypothetical protein